MNYKLICFDMDNTLLHSDKAHSIAFNLALTDLGFKKINEHKIIIRNKRKGESVFVIKERESQFL